jgi:hypothetical protein
MYLEISARRSGKTERLILEAVWCVYETQQQVHIVTGNTRMLDVIKNRLDDRCKRHIRFWTDWTLYNVLSSIGPLSDSNNMFFFDEFDFMNELFGESVLDIGQYNMNYYYATTPKSKDSYAVQKLLKMNNGHYISHCAYGINDTDWIDELFTL